MDFYYTPKRSPPFICYNPPLFNSLEPERLSYIPNEEPFQPRLPPFRTDDFSLNGGLESEIFITPLKKKDIELGITNKKRIDIGVEEALSDVIYYFKEIISFETELEKCREELARKADFRTSYLFSHFDLNNSHQIIIPEFQLGLKNLGIIANNDDIYMLIRRYSMDQIEKLK